MGIQASGSTLLLALLENFLHEIVDWQSTGVQFVAFWPFNTMN